MKYKVSDRRPIKDYWRKTAVRLVDRFVNLGITANQVSIFGMIAGISAGISLYLTSILNNPSLYFIIAAICIQLRLFANMVDGMVAVQSGQANAVGELFNEVPDRISDTFILLGSGFVLGSYFILGTLAACAALIMSYIRALGKAAGAHQEFCGPMAKPQRMFVIFIISLYYAFTPISWHFRITEFNIGLMGIALLIMIILIIIGSIRRLLKISIILREKFDE